MKEKRYTALEWFPWKTQSEKELSFILQVVVGYGILGKKDNNESKVVEGKANTM